MLILVFLFGCSSDSTPITPETEQMEENQDDDENMVDVEQENEEEEEIEENDSPSEPLLTSMRTYIFGHSLIVHDPPAIATPSNETTIPHWMHLLAEAANFDYAVSGQYGFLPQHDNLPPISQWGFDLVTSAWESDTESFAEANFNTILLTAGNFIQYQPAGMPYEGDNPDNTTPVGATVEIFDWVETQEPGTTLYIYENWPDMAGFISSFPPSEQEFAEFNDYTTGDFHDWWLDYNDMVRTQRPDLNVKMIPVGPILARLLTDTNLSSIPITELYEDDAPHGRASLYFLAGMVTYMAMYGVETPETYEVPDIVHETIRMNYSETVAFIWQQLENFNDDAGNSLVWPN